MEAILCGVPISGVEIISDALKQAYGESVVGIREISKSGLRTYARVSWSSPSVVLIVFDKVSFEECKSIDNGLLSSDKYHTYDTDSDLVLFLNKKFELHMEIPIEEQISVDSGESNTDIEAAVAEVHEMYESKLQYKDMIIRNLKVNLKDLTERVKGIESSDYDDVKNEIISLKSDILSKESEITRLNGLLEESKGIEKAYSDTKAKYESIKKELSGYRISNTEKTSIIDSKLKEVETVKKEREELVRKLAVCEQEKADLSDKLGNVELENRRLKIDLESKTTESYGYLKELNILRGNQVTSSELDLVKADLESERSKKAEYKKTIGDLESEVGSLKREIDEVKKSDSEKASKIEELKSSVSEKDDSLVQLNKEKLDLMSKVEAYQNNSELTSASKEFLTLKRELVDLRDGVFGKIASCALPSGSLRVNLIPKIFQEEYGNIKFIFSGTSESKKGSYKCLFNELSRANFDVKFLVVDVTSETCIDYVFGIRKLIPGGDWFAKGGGVQPYVSDTLINNVKVLSFGLRFVNDAYLLTVDWKSRLHELNNSGYQVFLYCGDIGSLVGRVFHESFAGLSTSVIYVHGNVVGGRSLILNLRGLTNADKSTVVYFSYIADCEKFKNIVEKTNRCITLKN